MGKKTTTPTKVAAPAKPAAKATTTKRPAARKTVAAPAKQAQPTAPKARRASKPAARGAAITGEDIALRAYFIAEKRRHNGLSGDEHHDWIEAERQIRSERKSLK